jgi:hypothetical protein
MTGAGRERKVWFRARECSFGHSLLKPSFRRRKIPLPVRPRPHCARSRLLRTGQSAPPIGNLKSGVHTAWLRIPVAGRYGRSASGERQREGTPLSGGRVNGVACYAAASAKAARAFAHIGSHVGLICQRNCFGSATSLLSPRLLGHPYRDCTHEVALADLNSTITQDRVSGREVEVEVRQHEVIEIVAALHVPFFVGAEGESDLSIS